MILGMSLATFTLLHVIISLLGIAAGFVVLFGMLRGQLLTGWNSFFLWTTIATSVTGFMFPFKAFGPPHAVGIISLIVLALALYALYSRKLSGSARWIYAACAVMALYLNVFVGVVQAFQKLAPLHALAPIGNEPPFAIPGIGADRLRSAGHPRREENASAGAGACPNLMAVARATGPDRKSLLPLPG